MAYRPEDLTRITGTITLQSEFSRVGFGDTNNGERLFVPAGLMVTFKLEVGDSIEVFAADNYVTAEGAARFSARWRTVRITKIKRAVHPLDVTELPDLPIAAALPTMVVLTDPDPQPQMPPAGPESLATGTSLVPVGVSGLMTRKQAYPLVQAVLEKGQVMSSKDIADIITPELSVEDAKQMRKTVISILVSLHVKGEVFSLKGYNQSEQLAPSHTFWVRDVEAARAVFESVKN